MKINYLLSNLKVVTRCEDTQQEELEQAIVVGTNRFAGRGNHLSSLRDEIVSDQVLCFISSVCRKKKVRTAGEDINEGIGGKMVALPKPNDCKRQMLVSIKRNHKVYHFISATNLVQH